MKKTAILFFAACSLAGLGKADQAFSGSASSAAPWLKIPSNARAEGMAEAGVALEGGVGGLSTNPAGLSGMQGQQVALMHNQWLQGSASENFGWGMHLGENSSLGLSMQYVSFGEIKLYDYNSQNQLVPGASINPYGYTVGLAYAHRVAPGLDLGAWGRYLGESIASYSAGGAAFDLGARWAIRESGFSIGAAGQNLGAQLGGYSLPVNVKAGLGWQSILAGGQASFALDGNIPTADSGSTTIDLGAEYWIQSMAALRTGYRVATGASTGNTGFNVGLGLRFGQAELNYAFSSFSGLGSVNLVQLLWSFSAAPAKARAAEAAPKIQPKALAAPSKDKKVLKKKDKSSQEF